jgi:uncharacterized membrane protein YiaA
MANAQRKMGWVWKDDDTLSIVLFIVGVFAMALLLVGVYFGDVPLYAPAYFAILVNVCFINKAMSSWSNYVDLGLSVIFFSFASALNILL